ncbi:RNA ligase partner protein [Geoglobus acetivorans]|uniref:RNA-free ribonuclease P n=2 Tax=Geoglobus acetivorans TaxID=565033 RepID=A0ABZ3H7P0_GEOAI|nr:RNA ligase partner protein [Geoglobus acetivorans]
MKQRFVLDTTAITDTGMRSKEGFENICVSANTILDLIAKARLKLEISCYVPYPSVYSELVSFMKRYGCEKEVFVKLDTWLIKKTPNRFEVKIPAEIFHEYITTVRQKINKAMRVAEEHIWESSAVGLKYERKDEVRDEVGDIISRFRDKFREVTRHGVLDSSPDLDVLLLAKELDAAVVSSDEGIKKWAEKMGLRFVEAKMFPRMLREYLRLVEGEFDENRKTEGDKGFFTSGDGEEETY